MANELNKDQSTSSTFTGGWAPGAAAFPATIDTQQRKLYEETYQVEQSPYTNKEIFKESIKNTFQDTTLGVIKRKHDINEARKTTDSLGRPIDNPMLTKDQANAEFGKYGVTFNSDIRRNEAEVIAAKKVAEYYQKQRLEHSEHSFASGASSLLGSLVGSLADPVNIATTFIPASKLIPALKGLASAGVAGRIAAQGIEGMIMNAAVEPLPLWMASVDQRDYTMADSLFNITAGGLFGAGMSGFSEGVRAFRNGEIFNSNLAAAIGFGNNRGVKEIAEFQKRQNIVTSFAYDDLVALPIDKLNVLEQNGNVAVRLRETGPLSEVVGYGKDITAARTSLRRQLGALLEDDSIFKGYRLDDGLDNLHEALKKSGNLADTKWMTKWIDTLSKKAKKEDLSLEDYLAKNSEDFTNFDKLVRRATQSRKVQAKFADLTGNALDDAIEAGAKEIDAFTALKDALAASPRTKTDFKGYMFDLRKKVDAQNKQLRDHMELDNNLQNMRAQQIELQKQLDMTEDIAARADITKQINDLNASLKGLESDITAYKTNLDIEGWKAEADNLEHLEAMHERLLEDPRTFDDVKEQLRQQIADDDGTTWDTSDSILDNLSVDETPIGDEAHIAKLKEDIEISTQDIKAALAANRFTKEEISALNIDTDGNSLEMRRADKRMQQMEELTEDAEHFAECRRTEAI